MLNYALDNSWDFARERLGSLAQCSDPLTRRRLAGIGIRPGWRCLDIGSGLGTIARWLCAKVGRSGRVVATDIDLRFLREIHAANFEARYHDIRTDGLPVAEFDLVCVRWLLHHLPEPERALAAIVKALRPGGWLLLEEPDFFPLVAAGSQPYIDFMTALTTTVVAEAGGGCLWARCLPSLIARQGLVSIGADAELALVRGGSRWAAFYQLTARQMRDRMIASGALSAEGCDAGLALLDDPSFWAPASAELGVWGRAPDRPALARLPSD